MAAKKKATKAKAVKPKARAKAGPPTPTETTTRARRSDEEKVSIVRQIMQSGNQGAEIKKLGIYPNQFYDWKKRYADQLGGVAPVPGTPGRKSSTLGQAAVNLAAEAKAYIKGKGALLDRLRTQRTEIDELITQLEE